MHTLIDRHNTYNAISSTLTCLSNTQIEQLFSDSQEVHKGIGGTSLKIEINEAPIFVKKVPITDLELLPENFMSTANIFELPMCYQYGIGSAGFNAWRELASHIITTNWVLTGKCSNFPIMYHWRILKDSKNKTISSSEQEELDKDTVYWENDQKIRSRLKAKALAKHHIYLFMEFIPYHLYDWLNIQLGSELDVAINAVKFVDHQMQKTNDFMCLNNFLHMDAHFENILTDGQQLYYSDFGLALYEKFNLSEIEQHFMQDNNLYDYASGSINLLHCIVTSFFGKEKTIEDYHNKLLQPLDGQIDAIVKKHLPASLIMGQFYPSIQKDKSCPYPTNELRALMSSKKLQDN